MDASSLANLCKYMKRYIKAGSPDANMYFTFLPTNIHRCSFKYFLVWFMIIFRLAFWTILAILYEEKSCGMFCYTPDAPMYFCICVCVFMYLCICVFEVWGKARCSTTRQVLPFLPAADLRDSRGIFAIAAELRRNSWWLTPPVETSAKKLKEWQNAGFWRRKNLSRLKLIRWVYFDLWLSLLICFDV